MTRPLLALALLALAGIASVAWVGRGYSPSEMRDGMCPPGTRECADGSCRPRCPGRAAR